jgi:hypothetical protein
VVPLAAARNYYSWRRPESGDASAIAQSRFVLVLRTFGHDGELLLTPDAANPRGIVPRARTLEEIVAEIAEAHGLATVGFADHDLRTVPSGIRYIKVAHREWREQFEELVARAEVIVVMPTPGQRIGDNFRSELAHLVSARKTSRTIVVGPPYLDSGERQATYTTYHALGWPSVKHVYLTAHEGNNGKLVVHPSLGEDDPGLAQLYLEAIRTAIEEVLARVSAEYRLTH